MCSMNISPTTSMNAIIKDSTMSSPSPASNQVVRKGPFENPSGWAACSISTSALPDPLPLPQPFRSSAHASRPACFHPLSLPPCVTAPWKIFNQHLSPMQPLLPRMYILTLRADDNDRVIMTYFIEDSSGLCQYWNCRIPLGLLAILLAINCRRFYFGCNMFPASKTH